MVPRPVKLPEPDRAPRNTVLLPSARPDFSGDSIDHIVVKRGSGIAGGYDHCAFVVVDVAQHIGDPGAERHHSVVAPSAVGNELATTGDNPAVQIGHVLVKANLPAKVVDFARVGSVSGKSHPFARRYLHFARGGVVEPKPDRSVAIKGAGIQYPDVFDVDVLTHGRREVSDMGVTGIPDVSRQRSAGGFNAIKLRK